MFGGLATDGPSSAWNGPIRAAISPERILLVACQRPLSTDRPASCYTSV